MFECVKQKAVQWFGVILLTSLSSVAVAAYPDRALTLIVPFAAGGATDVMARVVSDSLSKVMGQPVIVENKAGAGSVIGATYVANAKPDGYTLLMTTNTSHSANPSLFQNLKYDPLKDFTPILRTGELPFALVVANSLPVKTMKDLLDYAKANPGKLSYGSWGNGSSGHLAMEGIKARYGLDMPHVAYKSLVSEVTDLIANNISVGFTDIASPIPHMRNGRLVGLGQSGSQRWPATQDIPTLTEQGYKFDADGWYGVFAPAGTPQDIIDRLADEINRLQSSDEVRQKMEGQNMIVPAKRSARQYAESIKKDAATWQGLAITANLKEK